MQKNIDRQELLELCEALEKGNITLEQFRIIGNIEDTETRNTILNLMSIEGITLKNKLFEKIIKIEYIKVGCQTLIEIFNEMPIYKTDLKRQKFILELYDIHPQFLEIVPKLLEYDFLWNNKELIETLKENVQKIIKEKGNIYNFNYICCLLLEEIRKNEELYKNDNIIKLASDSFEITLSEMARDYLKCLRIKSLQKEPIWFECLKKAYEEAYNSDVCTCGLSCYATLTQMEEHNRIDILTKKLKEINDSNVPQKEKNNSFLNFMDNIITIDEETIESYEDEYFNYLVDQATAKDNFYETKELIEKAVEGTITLEEVTKVKENLEKIKNSQVRDMVLYAYLEDKDLVYDNDLSWFKCANHDKAKYLILLQAIKKNNQKYKTEGFKYFGERFSDSFVEYLSNANLTKEEIIEIRNQVKNLTSEYYSGKGTFIVDTSSIVDEKDTIVIKPKEQAEEKEEVTKGRSIVKSILSRFKN